MKTRTKPADCALLTNEGIILETLETVNVIISLSMMKEGIF